MREENFWYKKPRYSEVRVITRRVIARYDCTLAGASVSHRWTSVYTSFIVVSLSNPAPHAGQECQGLALIPKPTSDRDGGEW